MIIYFPTGFSFPSLFTWCNPILFHFARRHSHTMWMWKDMWGQATGDNVPVEFSHCVCFRLVAPSVLFSYSNCISCQDMPALKLFNFGFYMSLSPLLYSVCISFTLSELLHWLYISSHVHPKNVVTRQNLGLSFVVFIYLIDKCTHKV